MFLRAERITNSEFARKMGLSPAYIGSMRKSMPEEKVEKLCEIFPNLNRDWLLYGQGEMYADHQINDDKSRKPDYYRVPLLPVSANAGRSVGISEGIGLSECAMVISPYEDATLAIMVVGDSMEPDIPNGITLFLSPINHASFIPWGTPFVLDTENGTLVKKLYPSPENDDYLEARSINPDYPPFRIPKESIFGIYRILGQLKQGFNS